MRRSRRELEADLRQSGERIEQLIAEAAEARKGERACATQLERAANELSRCKDVVAAHIVAAGRPSTALHSPQQCMESLRQSLADAGVDLQLELARLEGSDL